VHIRTSDGVLLEARWDSRPNPQRVVVLCHPNPAQAGSMAAPLMRLLASHLAGMGWAVLRFNFRGVGESTGVSGQGEREVDDVAGAVTAALFLRRFVAKARRFAHFDLYGWRPAPRALGPKGGEPQTARAVLEALGKEWTS